MTFHGPIMHKANSRQLAGWLTLRLRPVYILDQFPVSSVTGKRKRPFIATWNRMDFCLAVKSFRQMRWVQESARLPKRPMALRFRYRLRMHFHDYSIFGSK